MSKLRTGKAASPHLLLSSNNRVVVVSFKSFDVLVPILSYLNCCMQLSVCSRFPSYYYHLAHLYMCGFT